MHTTGSRTLTAKRPLALRVLLLAALAAVVLGLQGGLFADRAAGGPSSKLIVNSATNLPLTTGDASDAAIGDGICATAGPPVVINAVAVPECTLRAAIEEARAPRAGIR